MRKKLKEKWPKSFKVGPHKIAVRLGKDIRGDVSSEECFGLFLETMSGGEIWLDAGMSKARKVATILHELCHALSETYGLDLKHRQVYGLGEGLAQALAPFLRF